MPRNPPAQHVTPSDAAFKAAHHNITISPRLAVYEALDARRQATGLSFEDLFVGALADQDQDQVRAAAHDEGVAAGKAATEKAAKSQRTELDREHRAAIAELKCQHEAALVTRGQQAQRDVDAAHAQGLAQADPQLRAQTDEARGQVADLRAAWAAYYQCFVKRGDMLLAESDGPAARALTRRLLDAQEAGIRLALGRPADQLPLPLQLEAEVAAAREAGGKAVAEVAAGRIKELELAHSEELDVVQKERDTALDHVARSEALLQWGAKRIQDLQAVVDGIDVEALAEQARRNPSDWISNLHQAAAKVALRPRLAAAGAPIRLPEGNDQSGGAEAALGGWIADSRANRAKLAGRNVTSAG